MGSLEERVADLLVVLTSAEIEEVDCYFSSRNIDFFDSVIYADGGDVFLHKPSLAVSFDDT